MSEVSKRPQAGQFAESASLLVTMPAGTETSTKSFNKEFDKWDDRR